MTDARAPAQRVIRTLVLTDLVDSTELVVRLGDARAAEIFGRVDRITRDLLAAHGGLEIDRTDGFLMSFERAVDGALFSLDVHDALERLSEEQGETLRTRAGIHLGEVLLRANAPEDVARGAKPVELEGLAKPFAARVMSLAHGGQTLLTPTALQMARRASVGDPRFEGVVWASHGAWHLKGVAEPVTLWEVTRGSPRAPKISDKAQPAHEGGRRWPVVALLLAAALAVGWWALKPSGPAHPVFTLYGAPAIYEDAGTQARLERGWAAFVEQDLIRARMELDPLVAELPLTPEVAVAWFVATEDLGDNVPMQVAVFGRIEPELLAGASPMAACAREVKASLSFSGEPSDWLLLTQRMQATRETLEHWLERHPDDFLAMDCLRVVSWDAEGRQQTEAAMQALLRGDPTCDTPVCVAYLVEARRLSGDPDEAGRIVARAAQAHPDSASLLRLLGREHLRKGDLAAAREALDRAVALAPDRLDIRGDMAEVALLVGDRATFERQLDLLLAPEWPDWARRRNAEALVRPLLRQGMVASALRLMDGVETASVEYFRAFEFYAYVPGAFSNEHLKRLRGMLDRPGGTEATIRAAIDGYRGFVELLLVLQEGDVDGRAPALAERVEVVGLHHLPPKLLVAAYQGDAEAVTAGIDAHEAATLAQLEGEASQEARDLFVCRATFDRAVLQDLAGDKQAALAGYADLLARPGCDTPPNHGSRALSAAYLVLDAASRGELASQADALQTFRELWPSPDPDLPVMQDLRRYRLSTNP